MSLAERLAPYEATTEPDVHEQYETTWCLTHMASGSSLQDRCYYAADLSGEPFCLLVAARVLC